MRSTFTKWLTTSTVVALVAFAGCGSDEKSSGGTAAPDTAAPDTAAPSATAAAPSTAGGDTSDDPVAAAKANLSRYEAVPTEIDVTEKLATKPENKSVYFMQCSAPVCAGMGDAVQEAAQILGMKFTRVDLGATPDTVAQAWDQAVRDHPDSIVGTGFPPELYSEQIATLSAAGVPYIAVGFSNCDTLRDPCSGDPSGITVNYFGKPDMDVIGALMADYVIADSGATGNAVFFHIPDFNLHVPELAAFEAEMASGCSECSADAVPAQVLDIGTQIPQAVVGYVQAHPDTNYVVMAFGDMAIGVPEALAAAGLEGKVKIVSMASGAAGFNYIKSGQGQVVDFGYPNVFVGWLAVDAIARVLGGQEPSGNPLPRQMIEVDDLDFDVNGDWPGVADFKEQFKALWGV